MKIEYLDPDWTCFIRCPHCPARSFACCEEHAVEEMHYHLSESHGSH